MDDFAACMYVKVTLLSVIYEEFLREAKNVCLSFCKEWAGASS